MDSQKILCTICARGGSKGVKNKNIKLLHGKPLILHTIQQAQNSQLFTNIVVSSDSSEILDIAQENGIEVFFTRDQNLSDDHAGKLDVVKDALLRSEKYYNTKYDIVIDLDVTSPLRDIDNILNAYKQFKDNKNENLITACHARRSPYFNLIELDEKGKVILSKQTKNKILRRQDSPSCFDMNASIYIWKRDVLLNNSSLFLDKTGLYVMPEDRSVDIDNEIDFKIVELLMGLKNENIKK